MSSWDYLDFELEIREGLPREYPVSVRSPAGEALAQMRFPYDEWELKDRLKSLEIALLRSGGTRRRIASPEENTVQDFGRGLFESLLVGDVRTRYEMSLSEARRQGKGLRLKLRIQPSELAVLPWEFLYDAERDRYPCLSSNTPLVRYLDLPQPAEPLNVSPPLRILGMVTSPKGLAPLDVNHEKRLVEEATRSLREDGMVELTWLEGQTWRHLQRAMRRGPWHIFHFVGHGGFDAATQEGALALSDDAGSMNLLRARGLAELLDDHFPLRLVFLNSCEGARGSESDAFSSTAATLVRRGVPAVVAMQYEITDQAAIEFSRDFYEALADSLPVDAAVTEARTAVSMDSALEWGTPVLYMHSPDGRVFDVVAPTSDAPPDTEDQQEERSARAYRETVESALADGDLEADEARRLRDLAVNQLGLSPEIAAGIEREVIGESIETLLGRQEEAARREKRDRRLAEAYTKAELLHRDHRWQEVVELFEQIHAEEPGYPDPEGLLASSRDALEQDQRVAALYERGLRFMEAEEHQAAGERFEAVQRLQPGYRDTEELLSRVREALSQPLTVEVPDLVGLNVSQARRILTGRRLAIGSQHEVPSESLADGEIIGQNPEPGTRVAGGSRVNIAVSSGPRATTATGRLESEMAERGYSAGSVRSALPASVGSWWALVLRGLIMGIFGLVLLVVSDGVGAQFRLFGALVLFSELVIATIDANTGAGRKYLLRTQARVSGLLGLLVVLVLLIKDTEILTTLTSEEVRSTVVRFIVDWHIGPGLIGSWAIYVGAIRALAATRLQRNSRNLLLLGASGMLLILSGICLWLFFPGLHLLIGFLLLASATTLVAVALRARRGIDN